MDVQLDDDVVFNANDTLVLCVDQEYEFNFRAKDVIHSAYFPHFRAQMNTVPGMTTRFKFTPDITTADMRGRMNNPAFNYILMCNKICGGSHYKMKLIVVVLDKPDYDMWYLKSSWDGKPAQIAQFNKLYKELYKRTPTVEEMKALDGGSKIFKRTYALLKPADAPAAPANGSAPADSLMVATMPADSLKMKAAKK